MPPFFIHTLKRIGWIIPVVLVGTGLDYIVHSLSPAFDVPSYYFPDKLIFAPLWLLVGLLIFWKVRSLGAKSLLVTLFFAVVLQTRYFLLGYPTWFVLLFLGVHFIAFLLPLYGVLGSNRKLFNLD